MSEAGCASLACTNRIPAFRYWFSIVFAIILSRRRRLLRRLRLLPPHIFCARGTFSRLTLRVAEGFSRLPLAAIRCRDFLRIPRDSLKTRVDFLFASGIKEVLEHDASSKATSQRPRVVSKVESELRFHDPTHRTTAKRLGVHTVHEAAPIGAAHRGAQTTTERPRSPPPVASAARRPSGRTGRLPGDSAVSVSTAAAIVVRAQVLLLLHRRTVGSPVWAPFRFSFIGGSFRS